MQPNVARGCGNQSALICARSLSCSILPRLLPPGCLWISCSSLSAAYRETPSTKPQAADGSECCHATSQQQCYHGSATYLLLLLIDRAGWDSPTPYAPLVAACISPLTLAERIVIFSLRTLFGSHENSRLATNGPCGFGRNCTRCSLSDPSLGLCTC